MNNTNLVLIPKKETDNSMKDLRPIAQCNVLYKIVAKVLANRLKIILPVTISENYSVVVPGHSITYKVLVALEVLHHMIRKNNGTRGEVALKLNVSKAYDRVDWIYLKKSIIEMDFSSNGCYFVSLRCHTIFALMAPVLGLLLRRESYAKAILPLSNPTMCRGFVTIHY